MNTATTPTDWLLTELTCPSCKHEHTPSVRLIAETSHRAAKRPVTPELVHLCPHCQTLLILSLCSATQEATPP
jgi:hypothetical protein